MSQHVTEFRGLRACGHTRSREFHVRNTFLINLSNYQVNLCAHLLFEKNEENIKSSKKRAHNASLKSRSNAILEYFLVHSNLDFFVVPGDRVFADPHKFKSKIEDPTIYSGPAKDSDKHDIGT